MGRNSDYKNIVDRLVFSAVSPPPKDEEKVNYENFEPKPRQNKNFNPNIDLTILEHELVFWMGDLNYRIDDSVTKEDVFRYIKEKNLEILREKDQLNIERSKNNVFQGFNEDVLRFYPTYKVIIFSF